MVSDSWRTSPNAWEERYYGYVEEWDEPEDEYDEYDENKELMKINNIGGTV